MKSHFLFCGVIMPEISEKSPELWHESMDCDNKWGLFGIAEHKKKATKTGQLSSSQEIGDVNSP
jgi:hypothetical protein